MKPTLFLRIASVLTFIFCAGHTIGGVFGKPAPGVQAFVAQTMKANAFDAMGSRRTWWDFNIGYGLMVSVTLIVHALLFWHLGTLVKTDGGRLRTILALLFVEFAVQTPIAGRYFFLGPCIISAVVAVCLLGAFFTAPRGVPVLDSIKGEASDPRRTQVPA
ncbi:MAG: hypothetical protein JO300_07650 [Silvibacterium sp.]|nr:hypothetical protein [Silvibacterium sp.]MBV8435894.1 hypothetical protein [Silvibacterium sp.]